METINGSPLCVNGSGTRVIAPLPNRHAGLPMVSIPIPGEILVGALKIGKTIRWTILRFADNQMKHALGGE